ncbi:hypothetical protein ACH5RR_027610 [Cinchona calisaya]|uniref:SHSP domain-containing protein n=1 Tax=Cinchona calisaya TaxID=153742 RepID=A0ABD2ZAZ1_9GENT
MRKRKVSELVLCGAAKQGISGLGDNPVQLYSAKGGYYMRVTLPTHEPDILEAKFKIEADEKVIVYGLINCGEIPGPSTRPVKLHVSNRRQRRLTPFAPFIISFKLPAPVEKRISCCRLNPDGTFEIIIANLQ